MSPWEARTSCRGRLEGGSRRLCGCVVSDCSRHGIERGLFGEDLSGCGNDCELGIVVLGVLDRGHILEELGITASLLDTLQLSIGLFVTMLAEDLS
jgi:hypothetical protein